MKIYVNSEHVNANVDFVTGKIRFDVPPGFGTVISADFDFDVPVRFDSDFFNASISHYGTSKLSDLNLVEIRV